MKRNCRPRLSNLDRHWQNVVHTVGPLPRVAAKGLNAAIAGEGAGHERVPAGARWLPRMLPAHPTVRARGIERAGTGPGEAAICADLDLLDLGFSGPRRSLNRADGSGGERFARGRV